MSLKTSEIGSVKADGRRFTKGLHRTGGKRLVLRAVKTDRPTGIVAGQDYAVVSSAIRNKVETTDMGALVTVAFGNILDGQHIEAPLSIFSDKLQ